MTDDSIVITQEFDASVDKIWTAITDKDQMVECFFEMIPDFKPIVGFETCFNVHYNGNDYLHLWRITEVIPMRKIVYGWKYGGYTGDSFVVWELTVENNKSVLNFSHHGYNNFPQDDPAFARESCMQGWIYFIGRLKDYLDN